MSLDGASDEGGGQSNFIISGVLSRQTGCNTPLQIAGIGADFLLGWLTES